MATGAALLAASVGLGGCGQQTTGAAGGVAGTLARLKPLTRNCTGPVNGYFGLDVNGEGGDNPGLLAARLQQLHDMTDQAAACAGSYMQVVAFSSTAADTATLGTAEFPANSGTETARLLQAGRAIDRLMADVTANLPAALRQVSPGDPDVVAQLTLARQMQAQRPNGKLFVELATGGVAVADSVQMDTAGFTDPVADAAGVSVQVPDLTGAHVRIVGIGQTTSPGRLHLKTEQVAAITDFYTVACNRTHAGCLVTTDYANGG